MRLLSIILLFISIISTGQVSEPDTSCLCGGIKLKPEKDGFIHIEWMPEYPGGNKSLIEHLKNNTHVDRADSGIVHVSFYISCSGICCGFKVIKTEGHVSTESELEILNVLRNMSAWKPGKQRDKPVDVPYKLRLKISNGQLII